MELHQTELYPAHFEWADHDCILIDGVAKNAATLLPSELCEVYIGQRTGLATAIVTIFERNIASLKEKFESGQIAPELTKVVDAMLTYAASHAAEDMEYCFVFVEP